MEEWDYQSILIEHRVNSGRVSVFGSRLRTSLYKFEHKIPPKSGLPLPSGAAQMCPTSRMEGSTSTIHKVRFPWKVASRAQGALDIVNPWPDAGLGGNFHCLQSWIRKDIQISLWWKCGGHRQRWLKLKHHMSTGARPSSEVTERTCNRHGHYKSKSTLS